MADLATKYMGLNLRNPLIIGSSGLTDSVEKVIELEQAGAGAVVLKSLFEEQILYAFQQKVDALKMESAYPEAEEYIVRHTKTQALDDYLKLIRDCRKAVSIPVIASINCLSVSEWINFAKDVEDAGASALELNLSMMPSDPMKTGEQNEAAYLTILSEVVKKVSIPVAAKISPHFTALANSAMKLSWTGIHGLVLFNRYYAPDIDLAAFTVVPGNVFSNPYEYSLPLRWTAVLSDRVTCDIAATTGIHDGETAVKMLLAGAKAVQICSVIYEKGSIQVGKILKQMDNFMVQRGFTSTSDFIGRMSMHAVENPASYERVQFMKHFSEIE
jgi:dihydroorotate dehydrogenase (fumarate)